MSCLQNGPSELESVFQSIPIRNFESVVEYIVIGMCYFLAIVDEPQYLKGCQINMFTPIASQRKYENFSL